MQPSPDPQSPGNCVRKEISGFVLAGGRSSRLGQDKVLLPWGGHTLLDHAVGRLQQVCGTVRVCADRQDLQQHLSQSADSVVRDLVIQDALPNAGPLAGIVAALEKSHTEWNFFLAVDLPLAPVELLQALTERAESNHAQSAGTLGIMPQVEGVPQPLCGLYHRSLVHGLRRALEEGKYKIILALLDAVLGVEGRLIPLLGPGLGFRSGPALGTPASRVELFDVQSFATAIHASALQAREWLLNINSPQDWQRACELSST